MKSIKLATLFLLVFFFTNCEKDYRSYYDTKDVQIVGFVPEKCYCCWGWVIKIGSDTIKAEYIPDLDLSEITGFPINASLTIGARIIDCPGKKFNYFEIEKARLIN